MENRSKLVQANVISKARICGEVKSLRVISIPAGIVGIIEIDIKMNNMHNLLENIMDALLTSNNVLF